MNQDNTRRNFDFSELDALIGGRLGKFDVPCPACSPHRRKRQARCLRIWHDDPGFLTYSCAHCGARGYVHMAGPAGITIDPVRLAQLKTQAAARNNAHRVEQHAKARRLWQRSVPARGTLAEVYLNSRSITCPIPATLRFLSANDRYPPTMLAAFGMPAEPEPGILNVAGMMIHDMHLTRLMPDGKAKADVENPKITLGSTSGLPIVLAPVNDLGGLAVTEGIEDALSVHQATGMGAWAAGTANRLPALAVVVPDYVALVTILVDDDDAGRSGAHDLAGRLTARGIDVELFSGRTA